MNCTCIKTKTKGLREHLETILVGAVESVTCTIEVLTFGDDLSLDSRVVVPFAVKADAKGYRGAKGGKVNLLAKYCPFCGTATEAAKAQFTEQVPA